MKYIQYIKASGLIQKQFDLSAKIANGSIRDLAQWSENIDWDTVGVGTGTVPEGAENISEVPDFEAVDVEDLIADREFDVKALKTLAILCNKRFTGEVSGAITKAEYKAEYNK